MIRYVEPVKSQIIAQAKKEALGDFKKMFFEGLQGKGVVKLRPTDITDGDLMFDEYSLGLFVESISNLLLGGTEE